MNLPFASTNSLQDQLKQNAAHAAVDYMEKHIAKGSVIGVGTGSTVNYFIEAMARNKEWWRGAVSSSEASTVRLEGHGVKVLALNEIESLPIYIDGADEITAIGHMIKGGGGALTREKIIASVAEKFVCIADASKQVDKLGRFPIPVEVIPMARAAVQRALKKYFPHSTISLRHHASGDIYITDNACEILDVGGLQLDNPIAVESDINHIVGVVSVGLFARRGADVLLLSEGHKVRTIEFV